MTSTASKGFGSFYAEAAGGEGERCNYPTRLDTYGCGCAHDCAYCYAKSLLDFRKNWNPEQPRVASTVDISKALRKVKAGQVLRLGGMTDCFQPLERVYGATRQAIQMMNARGIGYLIVTKSDLVADKVYTRVMDPELAHIQISVTSTSDEPNFLKEKASRPSDRLRAAERLSKAGFDVALRVSPYIPELIDIKALRASGVDKCLVEFLRVNGFISKWLEAEGYATSLYTQSHGGYRHLPLWKKQSLLRPFIIGVTSKTYKSLINHAADAGATAMTTEFFCMEQRSVNSAADNYKVISECMGHDVVEFYRRNSHGQGYLRLNRKVKEPYVKSMRRIAHERGMRFYVSDAHFKEACDNCCCCGLPNDWKVSRYNFSEALQLCKRNGSVRYSDITDGVDYYDFPWSKADGYNTSSTERKAKFMGMSMKDYIRYLWNTPTAGQSPYRIFEGVMKPDGRDENGDIIYVYDQSRTFVEQGG